MLRNEIVEFLEKINSHLKKQHAALLSVEKFKLKIIGKSSLLLGGMTDTFGTADIDSLQVDGHSDPQTNETIKKSLVEEFGRERFKIHDYYLEFVSSAIVFLPAHPKWVPLSGSWDVISVFYLDSNDVIASKCFSAFATPPRRRDRQDIVAALDQRVVDIHQVLALVDQIFKTYSEDARSDRFPKVYEYVTGELVKNYGGSLDFQLAESDIE